MRTAMRMLISAMVCCTALAVITSADTLEMKDGSVLHGKYVGGSQFNIRFMVNGKVSYYPTKNVLTLTFDSTGNSTASVAPPAPPAASTAPAGSAAAADTVTVAAGTVIPVRMIDSVDSTTNQVGDQFHAGLESDLVVNGTVVAPKGADVYGKLAQVQSAGSIKGQSELELELTGIRINGAIVHVRSGSYEVAGSSRGKQSAERIGGGAALGAIIGAIAGGGKGAAIGAGVGAGAGTAVQVMTKGQQVRVPSETVLDFKLAAPFTVPASH